MITAEDARKRTLNAIKETYKDPIEIIESIICCACDKSEYEVVVTLESREERDKVKLYLDTLGYNTWGSDYVLTVSWRSVKSNEE